MHNNVNVFNSLFCPNSLFFHFGLISQHFYETGSFTPITWEATSPCKKICSQFIWCRKHNVKHEKYLLNWRPSPWAIPRCGSHATTIWVLCNELCEQKLVISGLLNQSYHDILANFCTSHSKFIHEVSGLFVSMF